MVIIIQRFSPTLLIFLRVKTGGFIVRVMSYSDAKKFLNTLFTVYIERFTTSSWGPLPHMLSAVWRVKELKIITHSCVNSVLTELTEWLSELNDTPSLMLYIFDNFVCERMKWRSGLVSTSFAWIKTELKYSDTTTGLVSTSVVVWIETDNVMLMRTGVLEICFLSEAMIIHWDSYSCMNGRWMFNWKNKHMARYLPLWHH